MHRIGAYFLSHCFFSIYINFAGLQGLLCVLAKKLEGDLLLAGLLIVLLFPTYQYLFAEFPLFNFILFVFSNSIMAEYQTKIMLHWFHSILLQEISFQSSPSCHLYFLLNKQARDYVYLYYAWLDGYMHDQTIKKNNYGCVSLVCVRHLFNLLKGNTAQASDPKPKHMTFHWWY